MISSPIKRSLLSRLGLFFRKYQILVLSGLVSLLLGLIYLSVASSRLTNANFGSDGGDFLAAILSRGIPHPTGYPTYTLLGILFQYIPISTAVFRGVLESLLPAALAAGLLTAWVGWVTGIKSDTHSIAAVTAGFAWGVAPILFSQAVIVEVHGLQSLFIVIMLWWVTLNLKVDDSHNRNWILALAFLVGLGFGNHVTIALMVPAAVIAFIFFLYRTRDWRLFISQLFLILAGLLVYLYLPIRAVSYPPINWGNPQTWSGFIWEVTGNPYRQLVFNIPAPTLVDRLRSIASLLLDQFGAVGLVAGVIGLIHYSFRIKWLRWVLAWIFVVYFVFSIGYDTQDSLGYLIPAIMVYAVWIGLSLPALSGITFKSVPAGAILIVLLVLSIALRIPLTRSRLNPRSQDQPAQFAEQFLQAAPENAIVYTSTDQDTFPLWYYHFGLGDRPDLRIVVPALTQFVWYQETLMHTYPDLSYPALYEHDQPTSQWGEQIGALNPGRPECKTRLSSESDTGIIYQCKNP